MKSPQVWSFLHGFAGSPSGATLAALLLSALAAPTALAQGGGTEGGTAGGTVEATESMATATATEEEMADAQARSHFRVGRTLYDSGRFAEAATEFEAAYGLSGRPDLLYNIYLAHRDAQNEVAAAASLRNYLASVPDAADREHLEARLAALEATLAEEEAEAEAREMERLEQERRLEEARREAEANRARSRPLWPWGLVGGGAALAGVGIALGVVATSDADGLRASCQIINGVGSCNPSVDLAGRREGITTLAGVADALWITGAVVGVAGLVLFFVLPDEVPDAGADAGTRRLGLVRPDWLLRQPGGLVLMRAFHSLSGLFRDGSVAALFALGITQAGCSAAVGDLGAYVEDPAACRMDGPRNEVRDFRLELQELSPHLTHYFEASVVSAEDGLLQARVILEPLEFGTQVIEVPNMVPPGDSFLDFYADINGSRTADMPPVDHTWRRPVCSDGALHFTHIFMFEPLDNAIAIGPDFTLELTNVPASVADIRTELHLVFASPGAAQGRTVGMFRAGDLGAARTLTIPEVVDAGSDYAVMWFLDMNDDTRPNDGDVFCGQLVTSEADGTMPTVVSVDLGAALSAGTCMLTSLDYTQLL